MISLSALTFASQNVSLLSRLVVERIVGVLMPEGLLILPALFITMSDKKRLCSSLPCDFFASCAEGCLQFIHKEKAVNGLNPPGSNCPWKRPLTALKTLKGS